MTVNTVITALFIGIGFFALIGVMLRTLKNRYAPVRTEKAVIKDKNKIESFSKYSGTGKRERYVIVFSVEGKTKSFYVSAFSYKDYRVGQKGLLTYKGDKVISFQ